MVQPTEWLPRTRACTLVMKLDGVFVFTFFFFFSADLKVGGRVWRKQQVVIVTVKQEQIVTGQGLVRLGAGWLSRASSLESVSFSGRLKLSCEDLPSQTRQAENHDRMKKHHPNVLLLRSQKFIFRFDLVS